MDDFMFFSIIGAAAAMSIAWIWVVFRAFQESLGWGFATLLLNPLALLYALMRPARCKYPLILFGIALVFLLMGLNYARSKDHPRPVKSSQALKMTPNPSIERTSTGLARSTSLVYDPLRGPSRFRPAHVKR